MSERIVIALTGASGSIYGIRLLEELKKFDVEIHLILSDWARKMILVETQHSVEYIETLASAVYSNQNLTAPVASGSFLVKAMVISPCSMKTIAGIASGFADSLIIRAADVTLKEGRKLILVPRETPLNQIHLKNMLTLSSMGVIIAPPIPGFYLKPSSIDDLVNQHVSRILDLLGFPSTFRRWEGK